jgi:SAM-dependent methyltransferase
MSRLHLSPYEDPAAHARVSALIRCHSSNPLDVRVAMLRSLDVSGAEAILDLGCGFGFWAEELARRVAPTALFTGVDACVDNEGAYLRTIQSTGRRARFLGARLSSRLPFDDDSFDLVVATYSLYFFVDIIPETARVLRPGGRLLAVTHTEASIAALLATVGLPGRDSPLLGLIRAFSAENGEPLLSRTFPRVERVDYRNALTFGEDDCEDLLDYLRFKLPLIGSQARLREEGLEDSIERACGALSHGGVTFQKDDTLFVCGGRDD